MSDEGGRRSWRDLAWAGGLAVLVLAGAATAPPGRVQLDLAGYLLLGVAALATAARLRAPLPVLGVVTVCLLVYQVRGYPGVVPAVPVLVALYATVKAGHKRAAGVAIGAILAGGVAGELVLTSTDQPAPRCLPALVPAHLLHGIRVAARGDALLSPTITRRLISEYVARPPQTSRAAALNVLTNREREVVALAARGLSNDEIAARVVISLSTAKTHISRAMTKLRARDRAQLVVFAYESGLVTAPPAP